MNKKNSVIYRSRIVRDNKQFWSTEGEDGHMRQTAFEMWEWSNSLFTPYSITRIMSTENKKKERKMWERTIRFSWKMIFVVKSVRSFVCIRVKLSSALFYAFSIWMHLFIQKVALSYRNLYFIAVAIHVSCYKLLFLLTEIKIFVDFNYKTNLRCMWELIFMWKVIKPFRVPINLNFFIKN